MIVSYPISIEDQSQNSLFSLFFLSLSRRRQRRRRRRRKCEKRRVSDKESLSHIVLSDEYLIHPRKHLTMKTKEEMSSFNQHPFFLPFLSLSIARVLFYRLSLTMSSFVFLSIIDDWMWTGENGSLTMFIQTKWNEHTQSAWRLHSCRLSSARFIVKKKKEEYDRKRFLV